MIYQLEQLHFRVIFHGIGDIDEECDSDSVVSFYRFFFEVQEAGGGILFTMEKTRAASDDELLHGFENVALEMLKSGTTTLEAKSGYGDYRFEV